MTGISDIKLGAGFPDENAEGKSLLIKDGVYSAAYGVVVCDFELGDSGFISKKTAGEIYAYIAAGGVIVAVADYSGAKLALPCLSATESSGAYSFEFLTNTAEIATGTAASADEPIVITVGS